MERMIVRPFLAKALRFCSKRNAVKASKHRDVVSLLYSRLIGQGRISPSPDVTSCQGESAKLSIMVPLRGKLPGWDLHPISRPKAESQEYIRWTAVSLETRILLSIEGLRLSPCVTHALCPPDIPFRSAPPTSVSDISIKPSSEESGETDEIS